MGKCHLLFKNTMKKRLLSLLLGFTFLFAGIGNGLAYSDTQDEAVNYLRTQNVLNKADKFYPEKRVTKGLFTMWAVKNRRIFFEENERVLEPFADIDEQEFAPYVATAWKAGAVETSKYFYPNTPIQKLDALKMVFAIEGIPAPVMGFEVDDFDDLPKSAKDKGIIAKSIELGIAEPDSKNHFGVDTEITRLEAVNILYEARIYQNNNHKVYLQSIKTSPEKTNEDIFDEVWTIVHKRYLRSDEVLDDELMDAAIEGMIEYLNDPYGVYYPPEDLGSFLDPLEGELEGIGAEVSIEELTGYVFISNPLKNSPAEKAGLEAGDLVKAVDGVNVKGMTLDKAVSLIKGKAGTEVVLTIIRDGKEFDVTLVREKIDLSSVYFEVKDNYLICEVDYFTSTTVSEFGKIIEENYNNSTKGIIIDLRGNPGGFLDTAVDLLGYFFEKGTVALITEEANATDKEETRGSGLLKNTPLAVIVDEYSASSSEIFTGAIKDYERGIIIGSQTYGKGTVQELSQFYNDSALKITVAEWKTPLGNKVDGIGITPDIVYEDTEGDLVITRAIKELNAGKGKPKK